MAEKMLNTRIQQKHDIEANWLKATSFAPKAGEIVVYDPDATHSIARFKVGDGTTNVNDLPFATQDFIVSLTLNSEFNVISADKTFAELKAAHEAGYNIVVHAGVEGFGGFVCHSAMYANGEDGEAFVFTMPAIENGVQLGFNVFSDGSWVKFQSNVIHSLTFTGAVNTVTYDGTDAITVDIPTPKTLTFKGATDVVYDGSKEVAVNMITNLVDGEATGSILSASQAGHISINKINGEANATTYTYNFNAGDAYAVKNGYISLDKVNYVKIIDVDAYSFTTESTLSSTALVDATGYISRTKTGAKSFSFGDGVAFGTGASAFHGSAEGAGAVALCATSAAVGDGSIAHGQLSRAEGALSVVLGSIISSAVGENSTVLGSGSSHNYGKYSAILGGYDARIEGENNITLGGKGLFASGDNQVVSGEYNLQDISNIYSFIIGNGTYQNHANALAFTKTGDGYFVGDLYVNGDGATIGFDGAKKVATEEYVDSKVVVDTTLTIEGAAADAKVVGDLWRLVADDDDVIWLLAQLGLIQKLADEAGAILTDEVGNILLL